MVNGSQVRISKLTCISVHEDCFILASRADLCDRYDIGMFVCLFV